MCFIYVFYICVLYTCLTVAICRMLCFTVNAGVSVDCSFIITCFPSNKNKTTRNVLAGPTERVCSLDRHRWAMGPESRVEHEFVDVHGVSTHVTRCSCEHSRCTVLVIPGRVKPVYSGLCLERPLVLNDRFLTHGSFRNKMYPQ